MTDEEIENFINNFNDEIKKEGDFPNFRKSLVRFLFKNKTVTVINEDSSVSNISINSFIKKLKSPIKTSYFTPIQSSAIHRGVSYVDLFEEVKNSSIDSGISEGTSSFFNNLKELMSKAIENNHGNRAIESFFKTSFSADSGLKGFDSVIFFENDDKVPTVFYQDNNISLMLAMFRINAAKLMSEKSEKLKEIIKEYNKNAKEENLIDENISVSDFFFGKTINEVHKADPELYKLYASNTYKSAQKALLETLIEDLSPENNRQYISAIRFSLSILSPEKISGFSQTWLKLERARKLQIERSQSAEIFNVRKIVSLFKDEEKRQKHFNFNESFPKFNTLIEFENFLNTNIEKGVDLVRIKVKNYDKDGKDLLRYITPNYWAVSDNIIRISGWAEGKDKIEKVWGYVDLKDVFEYAKFSGEEEPYTFQEEIYSDYTKEGVVIKNDPENPLPNQVLKVFLQRGAYVSYLDSKKNIRHGNIRNVYPGAIEMNLVTNGKFRPKIHPKDVTKIIISKRMLEDYYNQIINKFYPGFENLIGKSHKIVNNMKEYLKPNIAIVEGDWVRTKSEGKTYYNFVVGSSGNTVYYLQENSEGVSILNTDKSKIDAVYKNKESFDFRIIEDLDNIERAVKNGDSVRFSNYSRFVDRSKLSNGDYAWSPSENKIWKVLDIDKNYFGSLKIHLTGNVFDYDSEIPSDAIFYTTRNIASSGYEKLIEYNNQVLTTVESLEITKKEDTGNKDESGNPIFKETKVPRTDIEERKILIPKNTKLPEVLLASNNPSIGIPSLTDSAPYITNLDYNQVEFEDASNKIIKLINSQNNTQGKHLVVKKIKDTNAYQRYDFGLRSFSYSKEKKDHIKKWTYIRLGNHKYRVVSRENNVLLLEYNTYNYEGKVITTSMYYDIDKDFEKNPILNIYVMKGNSLEPILARLDVKEKEKNDKISEKERINNIIEVFQNLYKIDVRVKQFDSSELKGGKAYIESKSGSNKIYIHADVKSFETELVHEYLHLFLAAAKYNDFPTYVNLMKSWMTLNSMPLKNTDFNKVEENFVKAVSKKFAEKDLSGIDVDSFLKLFDEILKQLKVIEDFDVTFTSENNIDKVFSMLNLKMSEITAFGKISSKKRDTNMLYFDLNFKSWMDTLVESKDKDNKLEINCE